MKHSILFHEQQRFNQWWFWLILVLINIIPFYGIYQQIIMGQTFGTKPMSNTGLIIFACFTILLPLFIFSFRLVTLIKQDGIYVRFYPIQTKMKFYSWTDINKLYIRKYKPLMEYGGWGLRYGFSGNGRALNVSGNVGLQIEFNNGNKLLIGTNKSNVMKEVLTKLGKLSSNPNK
jgi:hypothetical protein